MDVSKIISDAGAYGSLNRVKSTENALKTQERNNEAVVNTEDITSEAEVVVRIIEDASAQSGARDALEKESQSKGTIIDKKM